MTATPVGQRIRDVRLQHGIGLRQLARAIGCAPQSLLDWETGNRNVNAGRIQQVELALHKLTTVAEPAPPPRPAGCARCGGSIGLVLGELSCRMCGHAPEPKIDGDPNEPADRQTPFKFKKRSKLAWVLNQK